MVLFWKAKDLSVQPKNQAAENQTSKELQHPKCKTPPTPTEDKQ